VTFNGDGSEDLAIVGKVNESSLAEINNELANWILEDPRAIPIQGSKAAKRVAATQTRQSGENRFPNGDHSWSRRAGLAQSRSPAGLLVTKRKRDGHSGSIRQRFYRRDSANSRLPPLTGEAISETMNGRHGLIFWTGAKYAWSPTGN